MDGMTLRKQLMQLWKQTFGDSDEYISLFFDNYYNIDYIEYEEDCGNVISALFSVPYSFNTGIYKLKGLYLCGLSTAKYMRNKGVMSRLIERINLRAKSKGYDFTFLIPANEYLRRYYKNRGYVDAFYKYNFKGAQLLNIIAENYKYKYQINLDNIEYTVCKLSEIGAGYYQYIIKYLSKIVGRYGDFNLHHSLKDWQAVLNENRISNNDILICYIKNICNIKGIAFICNKDNSINVQWIMTDNINSLYYMVNEINNTYSPVTFDIDYYDQYNMQSALKSDVGRNIEKCCRPYGMLRLLDSSRLVNCSIKWWGKIEKANLRGLINAEIVVQRREYDSNYLDNEVIRDMICDKISDEILSEEIDVNRKIASLILGKDAISAKRREELHLAELPLSISLLLE
jgi:hypothetical protein